MHNQPFLRPRFSVAGGKRENLILPCHIHTALPLTSTIDCFQKTFIRFIVHKGCGDIKGFVLRHVTAEYLINSQTIFRISQINQECTPRGLPCSERNAADSSHCPPPAQRDNSRCRRYRQAIP